MPDYDQRPTKEFIESALSHFSKVWNVTHNSWRERDAFYFSEYEVWSDKHKNRASHRTSRARQIIDKAADHQLAFTPRVRRDPIGKSDAAKEAADNVEAAILAVMEDAALKETQLPFKTAGKFLFHLGYTVIWGPTLDLVNAPRLPLRKQFDEEEDFKGAMRAYTGKVRTWNPVRFEAIHPSSLLLDPEERFPRFAIKRDKRLVGDLIRITKGRKARGLKTAAIYERVKNKDGNIQDDFDIQDTVEWWTDGWHAFMATGPTAEEVPEAQQMLFIERNAQHFVPAAHAFGQMGMERTDNNNDPIFLAQGLLSPIMESIRIDAQRQSAHLELLFNTAYAAIRTTRDPQEVADEMAESDIIQGEEGDFGNMPVIDVKNWMLQVGAGLDADIESGTYPRTLGGQREAGVSTVGQQAILANLAAKKFTAPNAQLEHIGSQVFSNVLRLVDAHPRLEMGIGARGRTLRRGDINSNYNVQVTFEVADPIIELQRRQQGLNELQAGARTLEDFLDNIARVPNVSQYLKDFLKQEIRNNPRVHAKLALAVAQEMEGFAEIVEEEDFLEPEGAAGNGSQPRRGLRPEDLSGEAIAGNALRQGLTNSTAKPKRLSGAEAELGQE